MSAHHHSCEVLIVGGGPAGLAAAIALRQRGADVLVADAQRPPIDKACGEGLMPDSLRELARLGVELAPRDEAAFEGIAFVGNGAQLAAQFPSGVGVGVRRTALAERLLDRATELGVRTAWNAPATLRNGKAASVGGETCRYRWLIGADGHASRVCAWAGLNAATVRSRRFGFRAHFQVASWSRFVEIHWSELGQAYVTPVGRDEICVAAVTRAPQVRLAQMIESLPGLRGKLARAEQTTRERGGITLTRRLRWVTRGNVALIGDASGSADAITGEGLGMGFRQALLLAESLECGGLDGYEARHASTLQLPQRMAGLMLMLDRFPRLRGRALPALATRPELFRGLLAVHVGEEPLPRFVLRHGAALSAGLLAVRAA